VIFGGRVPGCLSPGTNSLDLVHAQRHTTLRFTAAKIVHVHKPITAHALTLSKRAQYVEE